MDYKKDTNISFNPQDSKNIIVFKLFEKDNYFLFVYKKSERLVSAFYLMSNLLSDNEPIKWQFRNIGLSIISQTLSLTSNPLSKSDVILGLTTDLVKLLSLLDIAYVAGLVSEMNFAVLKSELEHLLETLNAKGLSQSLRAGKKILFDKDFFAVPAEQLVSGPSSAKGFSQHHPSFPGRGFGKPEAAHSWSEAREFPRRTYKGQYKGHKYLKDTTSSLSDGASDVHTNATHRQTLIIGLLKSKSNLTIKDFSLIIKGCSDKTIQRELLKLVQLGVLKKEGERRWTRYSIGYRLI